ncbi:glycoside hydrolase family protein [Acanthamoeba castellanii str. Neff]|uniref:beta-galactosidase n=1 Tax=Acanthamoeba castellanii (strain ATCC 30010 / Neff) TaxID=1257118 RepID=L8H4S5_ACACF|nr:glycoside hydrolase family protein [Acanthamoeba castellanii str. Neff]ELR19733.1 glycoside hydrolase family protein [Acanthamoeba castellanii str. Neff]
MERLAIEEDWNNPAVVHRGREKARAWLPPHTDARSALRSVDPRYVLHATRGTSSPYVPSDHVLCLDGRHWKFKRALNASLAPEPAHHPFAHAGAGEGWADVEVPSNWQLELLGRLPGHPTSEGNRDVPVYTNIKYPFDPVSPPRAPQDNFVGTYAVSFSLPPAWLAEGPGGRDDVFLRFEAVRSAFHVWVNGHAVGYAQDSFTPKEFSIGGYVRPTDNVLFVRVYRWSVGSYLEDQDFWDLSGIVRSVCVHRVPPVHLRDVTIRTDFTDPR